MKLSRRQILAGAAGLGFASFAKASDEEPLFVEIPPAASGITWVHDNAM